MEEFNGVDSGIHCNTSTGTKEQLLTSCISSQSHRLQHPSPGIRYRNLGKSGLRVSNVGLGTLDVSPVCPEFSFLLKTLKFRLDFACGFTRLLYFLIQSHNPP